MAQDTLTFLLLNTASTASCYSHRNGDPKRKVRQHSPFLGKSLGICSRSAVCRQRKIVEQQRRHSLRGSGIAFAEQAPELEPLDLTEENIELVLLEARSELLQLFDEAVGITGVAELADMDGPFLTLRLKGRFWHERSMVLARLANYLQKRIPEICGVEIEDESQLDDSAANF